MGRISFLRDILPAIGQHGAAAIIGNGEVGDQVPIFSSIYKCRWAQFTDVHFQHTISIFDTSIGIGIRFRHCHFHAPLIISGITSSICPDSTFDAAHRTLIFEDCTFHQSLDILGDTSTLARHAAFVRCHFHAGATIHNLHITNGDIALIDCHITGTLDIHNCKARTLLLSPSQPTCRTRLSRNEVAIPAIYQ